MLAEAERKSVYRSLVEARLGERLPYEDATYDAVVSSGVLTTGHAPASSLDELVRVTRPGGHVVFTLRSDRTPPGYEAKLAGLREEGRWELVERGDEFQAMPTSEPGSSCASGRSASASDAVEPALEQRASALRISSAPLRWRRGSRGAPSAPSVRSSDATYSGNLGPLARHLGGDLEVELHAVRALEAERLVRVGT